MMKTTTTEPLLNVDEVAQILRVPRSWIYGRVHSSSLPFRHLKVGVYLRFLKSDVEDFIEKQLREEKT